MRYGYKKNLSIVTAMVLLIMVLVVPMTAYAEDDVAWDYEVEPLKENTWAPPSDNYTNDTRTIFSTKVGSSGKMTFKLSGYDASAKLYTALSDAKGTTYDKGVSTYISKDSYGTLSCAVEKGTYYLVVHSGKCKYSFSAVKAQKKNFSREKAQKLKAGKLDKIIFTWKQNYSRWYKISNPKKKKIKVFLNRETGIEIYNARMIKLSTIESGLGTKCTTTDKQPKGTYYIRVMADRDRAIHGNDIGKYVTIKWK